MNGVIIHQSNKKLAHNLILAIGTAFMLCKLLTQGKQTADMLWKSWFVMKKWKEPMHQISQETNYGKERPNYQLDTIGSFPFLRLPTIHPSPPHPSTQPQILKTRLQFWLPVLYYRPRLTIEKGHNFKLKYAEHWIL